MEKAKKIPNEKDLKEKVTKEKIVNDNPNEKDLKENVDENELI